MQLQGKTAIVTGAGRGIGAQIVQQGGRAVAIETDVRQLHPRRHPQGGRRLARGRQHPA